MNFTPTQWVIFFVVIVVPIGYGLFHLIRGIIRFNDWREERAARKKRRQQP